MLHLILAILKIIGIIIAVLLALILTAVLCFLFVPLRYKVKGEYVEKANGRIQVTWLLHLLSVRVFIKDNKFDYKIKILGRIISLEPKPKKEKRRKKSKKSRQQELAEEEGFITIIDDPSDANKQEMMKIERELPPPKPAEITEERAEGEPVKKPEPKEEKHWYDKIFEKFRKIIDTVKVFYGRIRKSKDKAANFIAMFQDEDNKETFGLVKEQLLKLWKHARPRKLSGKVIFGFESPDTTGQALAVLGIFYPVYGKRVKIIPDFTEKKCNASIYGKGRVRGSCIARIALKLYKDKNIKRMLSSIR